MVYRKEEVYYENAHRMCHPETCSCWKDYRIIKGHVTVDWADTESEAKVKVDIIKSLDK